MMCSLEEIKKYLPEGTIISPHVFMIGGVIGKVFHEEVICGEDVYRADITADLDPEGYRYGLKRVMSYDRYFCHSKIDENKTCNEVMSLIYNDCDGAAIWMNPEHPFYKRKTKYVSIYA